MQSRPLIRTVQRRAAEMAAGVVEVEKIAQARAFKTFFLWNPFPDWNILLNPIPVFEFGNIDKVTELFLLVSK